MSYLLDKKIGFIGGGQMAEAIFGGLIRSGFVEPSNITAADISAERLVDIAARFGVNTILNPPDNSGAATLIGGCDIVIIAVKPQYLKPVLEDAGKCFDKRHLVVSIVGGATLELLERYINAPVVRVMPNTPMLENAGVAGIALGSACTPRHAETVKEIFDSVGVSYILPETMIDPLTSVSGCGPAYAYMFIEALADGGVKMGLPRDMAVSLAAQTLLGSAKMVLAGGHPAQLKDNVCSPGGSTIAGVHALEKAGFRGGVMNAVEAAMQRMIEVGRKI